MAATTTKQTTQQTPPPPVSKGQVAIIAPPRLAPPDETALAEYNINREGWRTLTESIFPAATSVTSVMMALDYCKRRKLDVFKHPVHIVPIWNSQADNGKGGKGATVETIWPGINELRTTAIRTGQYAGMDVPVFGPQIEQKFEGKIKKWQNGSASWETVTAVVQFPEWCQITVYRTLGGNRVPFPGPRVYWLEAYARIRNDCPVPNSMWEKRANGQLEKCFGPETEVLTDQGFQRFDNVTGRIMQVAPHGLDATDAKPFRQFWDGPMIQANGDALNFRVTPNHDMLTTKGKIEAGDLLNQATSVAKFRIPLSVEGSRGDADVSDKALRLAAAFVCDGYARPYGRIEIAVSRPYKVKALDEIGGWRSRLLRECAGDEAVTDTRVITTRADKMVFSFDEEALEGIVDQHKAFDQGILLALSARQARLLVDAMIMHDGADNGRGTMRFYSSRPAVLGALELAAVTAGYAVSQRRARLSDIGGVNYAVTVSDKRSLPALRYSASQIGKDGSKGGIEFSAVNADGEVWCCRVPSGVIVVRRNGLSMLCGNCAEAAALRRAFPEEIGSDYSIDEIGAFTTHQPTDVTEDGSASVPAAEPKRADFDNPPADPKAKPEAEKPAGKRGAKAKAKAKDNPPAGTTPPKDATPDDKKSAATDVEDLNDNPADDVPITFENYTRTGDFFAFADPWIVDEKRTEAELVAFSAFYADYMNERLDPNFKSKAVHEAMLDTDRVLKEALKLVAGKGTS